MMKIQIEEDKFKSFLDRHWEWFEKHITSNKKIPATKKMLKKLGLKEIDEFKPIIIATKKQCLGYIKKWGKISQLSLLKKRFFNNFFSYAAWSRKEGKWNAYEFIQGLGIRVCPYCNRNNIDYSETKRNIPRSPFDHFFPKEKYPYLSCSLYNLIPSCYTCNLAKSNKDTVAENIIYPYEEEFGEDGKFILAYNGKELDKKAKDIRKEIIKNFAVNLKSKGCLKNSIDKSESIFHLRDLYSQEHNFIHDLLDKIYMYPEILDRAKLLGSMEKMFFTLFFNLPEDSSKIYPYQKITMDIIEQSRPDLRKYFPI